MWCIVAIRAAVLTDVLDSCPVSVSVLAMPKTTEVDMGAFLDAVEAERDARVCSSLRVYRRGMEPLHINTELLEHRVLERARSRSGPRLRVRAAGMRSASGGFPQTSLAPSRSLSPSPAGSEPVEHGSVSGSSGLGALVQWNGHFDGVVRPFRHGFVLGVCDAVLDAGRCFCLCSIFVDGFASNRVLRGDDILAHCLQRHLDGCRWDLVVELCRALKEVALAELRSVDDALVLPR